MLGIKKLAKQEEKAAVAVGSKKASSKPAILIGLKCEGMSHVKPRSLVLSWCDLPKPTSLPLAG